MGGQIQRRQLACAQEVGDVFHLYERHIRLLVLDTWRNREIDEPGNRVSIGALKSYKLLTCKEQLRL